VDNGLQSGKEDIFEGFFIIIYNNNNNNKKNIIDF